MELTEAQLHSFIDLYQKELGITLSKDQAHEKALSLLYFVSLCMQPLEKIKENDIIDTLDINQ